MEVQRDLKTSIHLAEYGYYKVANSTLRNVLENVFRFLYFTQFPEGFDRFGEEWFSLNKKLKHKIKFKDKDLKEKFFNQCDKLSEYTHSTLKTVTTNIVGFNVYKPELFKGWFKNFKDTARLIEKTLKEF